MHFNHDMFSPKIYLIWKNLRTTNLAKKERSLIRSCEVKARLKTNHFNVSTSHSFSQELVKFWQGSLFVFFYGFSDPKCSSITCNGYLQLLPNSLFEVSRPHTAQKIKL